MFKYGRTPSLATAVTTAVLFGALAGCAQTGSKTSTGTASAQIASADQKMMKDIAEANIAEIETAKLALSKSQDVHVRAYAQKMIDDHTNAMQVLRILAKSKGVELPNETDLQHKAMAKGLSALSGEAFDKRYIQHAGAGDHQRTSELLEKTMQTAADLDLRAHARQMLPIVQQHLSIAQQITSAVGGGR